MWEEKDEEEMSRGRRRETLPGKSQPETQHHVWAPPLRVEAPFDSCPPFLACGSDES